MHRDRIWLLGLLAALILAPAQGAAASVPQPPPAAVQCPPGMLCRSVIERSAWDERVTVILRPAWDEVVPVVLVPARTAMRSVVVRPADVIHHRELRSPARTITHTYLIEAAHYELQRQWVSSGHWQDYYIDTSGYRYRPGYYRTIPGEWRTTPGSSHWHSGYSVYVPGRSWQEPGYWATRPGRNVRTCYWWGWCYERYVPGSDYWVPGKTVYVPGYSYSVPGSSHWHDGYTYYVPPRSEWVPESREYVRSGYWATRYVDTSHYVTRRVWVPDLWGTRTEHIPAVWHEWDELVPAVMGLVPYTVPAVMGTRVVHHPAVTRTEIRHHDALTREIATDPATLSTQSRQSAASRAVPGTSAAVTGLRAPVSIPLVAGAGLGAGSAGGSFASSGRDSWWADHTAGGWVSSSTIDSPGASGSSVNSRAVSDAPLRGNAYLTSGGSDSSSGGGALLSDLLLLTGLATAGAAAHQLGRSTAGSRAITGPSASGATSGATGTYVRSTQSRALSGHVNGASGGSYGTSLDGRSRREPADPSADSATISPVWTGLASTAEHPATSPGLPIGMISAGRQTGHVVYHARTDGAATSIATHGFDEDRALRPRDPDTRRFGPGVYVADRYETAVKESAHAHPVNGVKTVMAFRLEESQAKIADFTDAAVASRYTYAADQESRATQKARNAAEFDGHNVMKWDSVRDPGNNSYAVIREPNRLLKYIPPPVLRAAPVMSVGGKLMVPVAVAADGIRLASALDADGGKVGRETVVTAGSVVGGWGGAAAGAVAGAAIGSVVPVVGTVAGALVGALIGGFAGGLFGSAAGEMGGRMVADHFIVSDDAQRRALRDRHDTAVRPLPPIPASVAEWSWSSSLDRVAAP